jgi:hypothetical protein
MKISESLEQLLPQEESDRAEDAEYRRLRDLYSRLRSEGRLKPPEYDLPQPDTIGRHRYDRTEAALPNYALQLTRSSLRRDRGAE